MSTRTLATLLAVSIFSATCVAADQPLATRFAWMSGIADSVC